MAITLHLKPDVEAGFVAHAQTSGTALEEHRLSLVEEAVLPEMPKRTTSGQSAREEAIRRRSSFEKDTILASASQLPASSCMGRLLWPRSYWTLP